ncbi:OsmC family protein [Amorphus coralli]|uniref:OsmC family protein n=1 Tax=Amorphus coralli TaxID=340680 RepID=UPI0003702590|nr:OsmC family protein [Amorphus coralli]
MAELTLEGLARPLVHEVQGLEAAGLEPPENRRGQSVRAWVRSLDGIQKEGITFSGRSGRAWRFASDEGAHLGGRDFAPNPLGYVGVGMAAAFMTELLALARMRSITLREPILVVENFYYRDGSFPKGTMVSGALSPEVSLRCGSDADPADLGQLLVDAVAATPISGLVRDEKISLFTLTLNGKEIEATGVAPMGATPLPDPGDPIAALRPADAFEANQPLAWKSCSEEEMIERIATDPPRAPTLSGTKKLLHLRTTCTLRPDGTYDCLREQYAQASSSWTFVVDDRPDQENAIAPDSASVFAIGLIFCFMTQMGRYAHMAKLPLDSYRVVQDLHLTQGGASAGSGERGDGDPVETHVFVDSPLEADAVADIVRVAERTCFLHALCRDRAKVKVRQAAELA